LFFSLYNIVGKHHQKGGSNALSYGHFGASLHSTIPKIRFIYRTNPAQCVAIGRILIGDIFFGDDFECAARYFDIRAVGVVLKFVIAPTAADLVFLCRDIKRCAVKFFFKYQVPALRVACMYEYDAKDKRVSYLVKFMLKDREFLGLIIRYLQILNLRQVVKITFQSIKYRL